jgi:hypothetical protein
MQSWLLYLIIFSNIYFGIMKVPMLIRICTNVEIEELRVLHNIRKYDTQWILYKFCKIWGFHGCDY